MAILKLIFCFLFLKLQNGFSILPSQYNIILDNRQLFELFQREKQKYNKKYSNQNEEDFRFEIFKNNFLEIQNLNQQQNGKGTFYNLNDFFDISKLEFQYLFDSQQFVNSLQSYSPQSKIFDIQNYHSNQIHDQDTKLRFLKHLFDDIKIDPIKLILYFRQNQYHQYPLDYGRNFLNNNLLQNTIFDTNREEWCIGEFLSQHFSNQNLQNSKKNFLQHNYRRLQSITQTENEQNIDNSINSVQSENSDQENEIKDTQQQEEAQSDNLQQQENIKKKKRKIDLVNELYFRQRQHEQFDSKIKNPFDKYSSKYEKYQDFDRNIIQDNQQLDEQILEQPSLIDDIQEEQKISEKTEQQERLEKDKFQNNDEKQEKQKDDTEYIILDGVKIPKYFNWNENGNLNYVKNQRYCNACYAFGAISALEAHQILYKNNDQKYSEQEVVDCNSYNSSCYGGQPFMVFDYILDKGIHKEQNYQYVAIKSRCKAGTLRTEKIQNLLNGYLFIRQGIKNVILATTVAPIVVVSYASQQFKFYQSGIYYGEECDGTNDPNHTSLVYGYDLTAEVPYLMLKTNWGASWGENGHYKLAIGELTDDNYGPCLYANTPYNVMPII